MDKLIVGLGNPGPEYEVTPHNLGFLVIDRVAERNGIKVSRKDSMALVGQGHIADQTVMLAKPQTFMNVSGPSVKGLLAKHEIATGDLLVVYDELDLPWQSVRIRPGGSHGGHHGIESVIRTIGTQDFARLRLGIHGGQSPNGESSDAKTKRDGARIVLGQFSRAQKKELDELLDYAARAVESIIAEGVEKSMTSYNRRAQGLTLGEE
ncbi:MAG: aminoacyl-tRNA hydrolase [Bryobacteraceae bacterium]